MSYYIRRSGVWSTVVLIGLVGLTQVVQAQRDLPQLVDVTEEAGITFVHSIGDDDMDNLIESNGAGCAFFDYDGDGDLDVTNYTGAYV